MSWIRFTRNEDMREARINTQAKEIKMKKSIKKVVIKTEMLEVKKYKKKLEDKITKNVYQS